MRPGNGICLQKLRLFVLMAVVLGGVVILLINEEGGKMKTQLLILIRNIGYVDACVSVLSLQSALLSEFGKGQESFGRFMNGITGAVVCLMVLGQAFAVSV